MQHLRQPAQKTGKTEEHPMPSSLKLESNKQTFCEENTGIIYLQNTSNRECIHFSFSVKISICSTELHTVNSPHKDFQGLKPTKPAPEGKQSGFSLGFF